MTNTWDDLLRTGEQKLSHNDAVIARLIAEHGHCDISPHTDYYHQLVRAIIGQQLSVKAASTILKRFKGLFDDAMPKPEQILATDTELLRTIGCSYQKVNYIKDLAQHVLDGRLDLAHIATLPNDVIIAQLTAVKGIGEWSAHMFMMFCLGRLDILPTGDLGVRKGMMQLYGFDHLPSAAEMTEVAKEHNWSPYESIASWYMWRHLDNGPK